MLSWREFSALAPTLAIVDFRKPPPDAIKQDNINIWDS
jgi:hypothetical protein